MKNTASLGARIKNRVRVLRAKIAFFLIVTTSATCLADNSIKLQVVLKGEHDDPAKSVEEVNRRWLEISATAFRLDKPGKIRLEWSFWGDNLDLKKVVRQAEGTEFIELAQSKQSMVKTKEAVFKFTPRHSVKSGSGRRAVFKRVEATGIRYHGWAVRAFMEEKLVGEAYSMPALKKEFEDSK